LGLIIARCMALIYFLRNPYMTTQPQPQSQKKPVEGVGSPQKEQMESPGTFKTDVSETDEEGTTVREAEVREDDLSEPGSSESGGHAQSQ
jgi:hypothetical protein